MNLYKNNFLKMLDLSKEEILEYLKTAAFLKEKNNLRN